MFTLCKQELCGLDQALSILTSARICFNFVKFDSSSYILSSGSAPIFMKSPKIIGLVSNFSASAFWEERNGIIWIGCKISCPAL